jgi:hypothetical protein
VINVKDDVLAAMEADSTLVGLLGGKRIYQAAAPNPEENPRVTFYEMDNKGALKGDDQKSGSEIIIVVDVWRKGGSTTAIAQAANDVMIGLGFEREFAGDLYEPDTKFHHKTMRFRITKL